MSTFTAIALDRLLEPGASKPVDKSAPTSMPVPNSQKLDRGTNALAAKKKVPRPPLKPALYTTPEVTPLPDAPSSFPPSPYIINHKRRGPRLLKSTSEASVLAEHNVLHDGEKVNGKSLDDVVASSAGDLQVTFANHEAVKEGHANGVYGSELDSTNDGDPRNGQRETGSCIIANGFHKEKEPQLDIEIEDFFDPQDSMSFTSNIDGEENAWTDVKYSSSGGEFYDAREELSSVEASSDGRTQNFAYDFDSELRQMRLSLLMEIEKRKQAEESLNDMRSQWERIRQELYLAGIVLPADLSAVAEGEQLNSDPISDLHQQVCIAKFVANAIGRGTARAEVEMEMEAKLESKNFEIARLLERLHFYETMNKEMSQRNQEAIEMARRERQRRSRRQRWVWGSITTAIVLGTAAIAWSYLPMGKGSSSVEHDLVPEHEDAAN